MDKVIKNEIIEKDYINDLARIKETIRENQNKAMVVVNSAMILTYYEIGKVINERKTWGSKYIQKLSNDLSGYGKGYSYDQLKRMAQFANEFSDLEIRAQPVPQIPWSTLIIIMQRCSTHNEMLWYINEAFKNGWSRNTISLQMSLKSYERNLIEPSTSEPIKTDESLNEIFKDTYVFDFIDKNEIAKEKDLKNALTNNIIKFLQELGPGFTLAGKEYKITTPTGKDFYIDLLMYNTKVHAYVVIEVKIGEFSPADIGQLMFYTNAVDKLERIEGDNETIGLLLCKDADKFVAETTLDKSLMRLGISKYKILKELPEYLERKLNEK